MKQLIFSILFLVITYTASASQITHLILQGMGTPITKTIQHLQPNISWQKANNHAWIIYRLAEETGIDWKKIVAITFQESSFKFFRGDKACGLTNQGIETCVYKAFGPMHIYYTTWKDALRLDPFALMTSLEYGYRNGVAILLRLKSGYQRKEPSNWYGRYNSSTRHIKRRYVAKVDSIIKRINLFIERQTDCYGCYSH